MFILGLLIGALVGMAIMAALALAAPDRCTGNCNQGRRCHCMDDVERQVGEALHPSRVGLE